MTNVTALSTKAVLSTAEEKLKDASRGEMLQIYEQYKSMRHEQIRRLVIEKNRIDILGMVVLGLDLQPFHLAMLRFQFLHPVNVQLAFRGAGKTTSCTVLKCIHLMIKDRNIRIALVSKTKGNSQGFLKEIKGHLENNEKLIEIFGEFYNPHIVNKWDDSAIEIVGRTEIHKEATITCLGMETAVASKHYDVHMVDDLVDEENSRTQYMRDKMRSWFYQVLDPTLNPPNPKKPHCGESHRLGTRYHYADIYGYWIEGTQDGNGGELKEAHQIIPILKDGKTPWPARFSAEWAHKKKQQYGTIIFNAQMQCDTEAMKGEIFRYDDCIQLSTDPKDGLWPKESDLKIFGGIDLAIGQKETNDYFCIVIIGCDGRVQRGVKSDFNFYVLDYFMGRLRFKAQTEKIVEFYKKWKPIAMGIETVQYQEAQLQNVKDEMPDSRVYGIKTDKDKMVRAWKLSPIFENGRAHFKKGMQGKLIDQLVLFPNNAHDDGFDALDFAVQMAKKRPRKKARENEPGVM